MNFLHFGLGHGGRVYQVWGGVVYALAFFGGEPLMPQGLDDFLRDYVDALSRGSAGLFVGAGLSMGAGLPSWSKLLDGMARDLGLEVSKERDLVSLAQWYVNHHAGSRADIAGLIRRTFDRNVPVSEGHRILARLPLQHIWTTNYDELLEDALQSAGRMVDVKSRNADLTTTDPEADTILYKMHGTATQPDEIVLTTDDYELFSRNRPGFLQVLGSDLATRTFLFLGLSFEDPNLASLMSTLRGAFRNTPRKHYAIMRKPSDAYEARRFEHFVRDQNRYGIRTLVIDDFGEVKEILERVERRYAQRNVFVSGSFPEDGDSKEQAFVASIARGVGRLIGERGLGYVSGHGRVVGSAALSGMVEALEGQSSATISRRVIVRPVRDVLPSGLSLEEAKKKSREDLIALSGILILIAGFRQGIASKGVLEELLIARERGLVVLPIAATGHVARAAWEEMRAQPTVHLCKEITPELFDGIGPGVTDEGAILAALGRCMARIVA